MSIARRARPLLAALLTVAAVTPFVAARAGAPTGDDLLACGSLGDGGKRIVEKLQDGWVRINSPAYASGEGDAIVEAFAAPSFFAGRLYVTNGQVIQASSNAGCKWNHIYPAPSENGTPAVSSRRIAQLAAPMPLSLWVASYDNEGGVPRPHVEMSTNATPVTGGGTTEPFTAFDRGLPAVGQPVALQVPKGDKNRAYVLIEAVDPLATDGDRPTRTLYTLETDALLEAQRPGLGIAWQQAGVPSDFGPIDGMTANTSHIFGLWIWSGSKYAYSHDGGATFSVFPEAPGPVTAIDVSESDRRILVAVNAGGKGKALELGRTEDPKVPYRLNKTRDLPVVATSIVHGQEDGVYAVSGVLGRTPMTYGFDTRQGRWASIHPAKVGEFVGTVMAKSSVGRIFLGQSGGALYRFDLYKPEGFLPLPKGFDGSGDYGDLPDAGLFAPTLDIQYPTKGQGRFAEVTVKPGEIKKVPVDLGINPDPTPLDVYFLLDTTSSMQSSIDALKLGVANIAMELARRTHGQACFGLGEFKDEGLATQGGGLTVAYQRRLPITCEEPPLPLLTFQLSQMKDNGGNQNTREAGTIGLQQAVTGKGHTNPLVLPNQHARFRAGNVSKVIVLISDAGFMQGSQFPTIEETLEDLNGHQISVVGIAVHDKNPFAEAKEDITAIVKGTHTVAPENGVDCDDDGRTELAPGDPLVCEADGAAPKLAPAIVGLLLGVKDMGTVALTLGDPYHVVKKVDGKLSVVRNLKLENHIAPTLHVTCAADQDGMDLPVRMIGIRRTTGVIDGTLTVHCRAPKIPDPPPPPPQIPEPDLLPAPRPQAAPILLPQFQPPPVNNPISNINPNAGFSQQEEQQLQLAAVGQDAEQQQQEEEEVELAMSAVREQDAAAAGLVWGCAMFVGLAGAVGVAHRRRTQRAGSTAYARVRY